MYLKSPLVALLIATFLAGCGGGGSSNGTAPPTVGGSGTSATSATGTSATSGADATALQATDATALQISVPAPTYATASLALSAFNAMNTARQTYWIGLLAQNSKVDLAATNHAQYELGRYQAADYAHLGHYEDPAQPGYTGVRPTDRVIAAGYQPSGVGESYTDFIVVDGVASDPGVTAVNVLLSGPYHRFGMLSAFRDVGIGVASMRFSGEGGVHQFVTIDYGIAKDAQQQLPQSTWVGVWPAANATQVLYSFAGETPNPIPVNNGACAGYPVSVQVRNDLTLNTSTFTLTEVPTNTPVSVQLSTAATDANPAYATSNSAYIIPYQPLKLGTQYQAHFVGSTSDGRSIDKTWTFTTMTSNVKMIYGCNPS